MLFSGVQEMSEDMWLHILVGHLIQTRLLGEPFFYKKSYHCVQASWQGPVCSRNNMYLYFQIFLSMFRIFFFRINKTRKLTRRRIH